MIVGHLGSKGTGERPALGLGKRAQAGLAAPAHRETLARERAIVDQVIEQRIVEPLEPRLRARLDPGPHGERAHHDRHLVWGARAAGHPATPGRALGQAAPRQERGMDEAS